jgi:hypothetical protein
MRCLYIYGRNQISSKQSPFCLLAPLIPQTPKMVVEHPSEMLIKLYRGTEHNFS